MVYRYKSERNEVWLGIYGSFMAFAQAFRRIGGSSFYSTLSSISSVLESKILLN